MGRRPAVVIAAFALGVSVVGGVAVAASSSPHVNACANSAGVLRLLSHSGKCPSGFTPIAISDHGPKGATGAKGPRGVAGQPGARGPRGLRGLKGATGPKGAAGTGGAAAQSSIATTLGTIGKTVTLSGTALTIKAQCVTGTSSSLVITGADDYLVHGVSDLAASGSMTGKTDFNPFTGATSEVIDVGSGLIDYESNGTSAKTTSDIKVSGTNGTGKLSSNLLLSDGTETFTIDVFLTVGPSTCAATAQISPAG
jgi:Collagen triple helix repeat (20 copies)